MAYRQQQEGKCSRSRVNKGTKKRKKTNIKKKETEAKSWKASKEVRWSKTFGFYSNGGRKQLEGFKC